ncbi:MAG: MarR family transcriptional regulator [Planctomycetes bacterium]|nr:MarR family transcriptional regulator [Planctomycetota bacterium]
MPQDRVDSMLAQWKRERPELDRSGLAIVLRILMLSGHMSERLKQALLPFDLAAFEFDVLSALRRTGKDGGLSPGELCESAQLTTGAMTHRLRRLEARGYVQRLPDPNDGRGRRVRLTPSGRRLIDKVIEARMRSAADSVRHLDRGARKQLTELLRELSLGLPGEEE